jgi:hypothetical protein
MLAYPESTYEERQQHTKIYFVEAIPETELRMMISTARPTTLDEAICLAEEFEDNRTSRSGAHNVSTGDRDVVDESKCMTKIENMQEKLCENNFRNQRPDRYSYPKWYDVMGM